MNNATFPTLLLLTLAGCGENKTPTETVDPPVATTLTLSATSLSFSSHEDTQQLTATVKDQNGATMNGAPVAWVSSASTVASVSSTGLVTAVADGTATITGTSGSATATASVAVLEGEFADPAGGEVSLADGAVKLVFPPNAVSQAVFITAQPATGLPAEPGLISGTAFDFGPDGTAFDQPVTLTIGYDPANVPQGVPEEELGLHKLVGSGYVPVDAGGVDVGNHTVSGSIDGFSVFVIARTLRVTTTSPLPDGTVDVAYSHTLAATGGDGSYSWALASGSGLLPTGLSLATTGDIAGTPTVVGTQDFTVEVTSGGQTAQQALSIRVISVTTTSGVIDSNTTWTAADGPYLVTGNVLVSQGVTLTIEPGTRVVFDGLYYIKVEGELVAIGTPTDSVVFTSWDSQPAAGDWSKIWFASESVDATVDADGDYVSGSAISHAVISYGGAIHFDASSPYFSNNHVHHVTGSPPRDWPNGAIWTCNSASLIRDNVIEDNPLSGIVVLGGAVKIQGNIIRRNTGYWGGGIFFANPNCAQGASGTALVEDNQITENTATFGGGIALYSGSPKIWHNDIKNNIATGPLTTGANAQGNGAAIVLFSGGGPEITYNNIENNSTTASGQSAAFFFSWSFSGIIQHNNLANPTTYEIYLNSNLTTDVDATSNYWNTTATTEIDARIWDDNDDFELGLVGYTPILTLRETTSGPRP